MIKACSCLGGQRRRMLCTTKQGVISFISYSTELKLLSLLYRWISNCNILYIIIIIRVCILWTGVTHTEDDDRDGRGRWHVWIHLGSTPCVLFINPDKRPTFGNISTSISGVALKKETWEHAHRSWEELMRGLNDMMSPLGADKQPAPAVWVWRELHTRLHSKIC